MPNIWQPVKQSEVGFQVRRKGAIAKVLRPVDGIVSNRNDSLQSQPHIANESCFEKGWLFTVEAVKLRSNLKSLYYGQEAHNFFNEESEKLFAMAHQDLRVAADGGVSAQDIFQ